MFVFSTINPVLIFTSEFPKFNHCLALTLLPSSAAMETCSKQSGFLVELSLLWRRNAWSQQKNPTTKKNVYRYPGVGARADRSSQAKSVVAGRDKDASSIIEQLVSFTSSKSQ